MSDELISIEIDPQYLESLADLIEELNPPSKVRYYLLMFMLGIAGGVGLGLFLGWMWVKI